MAYKTFLIDNRAKNVDGFSKGMQRNGITTQSLTGVPKTLNVK